MEKKQYFTLEFICDNKEDCQKLCRELMKQYPTYFKDGKETMITMWIDGKCPDYDVFKTALMDISNRAARFGNATAMSMKRIAEEALGYNEDNFLTPGWA